MNNINKEIGNKISARLRIVGKSQADLAEFLNVSQAAVSNWISGAKAPRLSKIDDICYFLRCSRSDLLLDEPSGLPCRIKKLRLGAGLSQRDLAKKLHLSPSTIGMYESGARFPTPEAEISIAQFFGVSLDYLRGLSNKIPAGKYIDIFASYSVDMQKRLIAYAKFLSETEGLDANRETSERLLQNPPTVQ